jgi:cysteine desulfurase
MALVRAGRAALRLLGAPAAPAAAMGSFRTFTAQPEPVEEETIEKKGVVMRGAPMYLDMQATTPMDPRVVDAMLPFMTEQYGNPHSRTHLYGWEAEEAVEVARGQVASVIGADAKEIIFTSGATESNNLAIKGVAQFYKDKKNHVITTQTDHKCVLDSCRYLQQRGFEVTYLPVQKNGLIDLQQLADAIRPETSLVSVMAVNNEIGVVQPLADIGALCREKKVFFHTDAAQVRRLFCFHFSENGGVCLPGEEGAAACAACVRGRGLHWGCAGVLVWRLAVPASCSQLQLRMFHLRRRWARPYSTSTK